MYERVRPHRPPSTWRRASSGGDAHMGEWNPAAAGSEAKVDAGANGGAADMEG